jgi:hypothetical protein
MQPQLPWPQSIVFGWHSCVQNMPSQFGALSAETQDIGWQHADGTQSASLVHSSFVFELKINVTDKIINASSRRDIIIGIEIGFLLACLDFFIFK